MLKIMIVITAIVLVLHGLIHLMGTAVYMKLGVIQQLPYKATVLGGRWDLGAGGIAVYGALWAVAAINREKRLQALKIQSLHTLGTRTSCGQLRFLTLLIPSSRLPYGWR